MDNYQDLVKRLTQINEGASIVSLDVSASGDELQGVKSVLVGILMSSGAQISATFQAPCFETLLDALETFFNVQSQIVSQAIEQVNVMAGSEPAPAPMGGMPGGMGMDDGMGDEMGMDQGMGMEPDLGADIGADMGGDVAGDEMGFELGADAPSDDIGGDDVVIDTDSMGPEIGDDVDTDEARYSHNYSFRNTGTGLFQSLTGQQRIQKGALRTAKKRLGN